MTVAQKFLYLFWAYNIIWLLIGGYLLLLGARQRRIQRLLERMRASLKDSAE
ncbi:MAG: CcmD family protein [Acidobacteriota bacterium]